MTPGRRPPPAGRPALVSAGAVATMLLASATPSQAYVQYQTITNGATVLFHWKQTCVPITVYPNDLREMTPDEIEVAASAAAGAWSRNMLPCTFLDLQVTPSMAATRRAKSDGYHVVVFRNPWCDPAHPELCLREALAVTSVYAGKTSGVIQDADIEVNSENFVWADLAVHPANGEQDLQNALTHEMGHLAGLDHNCYSPGLDPVTGLPLPRQIDNTGVPVPDCRTAPLAIQQATMFNSADLGDLTKRTLEPDDQQAMCDIYPAAADPNYCPPPPSGDQGCACQLEGPSGAMAAGAVPALLLPAVAALLIRRRRRPRPRG